MTLKQWLIKTFTNNVGSPSARRQAATVMLLSFIIFCIIGLPEYIINAAAFLTGGLWGIVGSEYAFKNK